MIQNIINYLVKLKLFGFFHKNSDDLKRNKVNIGRLLTSLFISLFKKIVKISLSQTVKNELL